MTELEFVRNMIVDLEDDLQHYTMVEKDKCKAFYIQEDLKHFKTIEQALIELNAIKEAKPSKAMEELDFIGKECYVEMGDAEEDCILFAKDYIGYNTIKQTLQKAQELEKENAELKEIVRIIIEKQFYSFCKLTQEELSLLKKWEEKYQKSLN